MHAFFTARPTYFILRLIMGVLFIWAGAVKLSDPQAFATTINLYGLVTWSMAKVLAHLIPAIEIITGLGLIMDIKGALEAVVAFLLGFMGILLYAIYLGLDADCGCFGTPSSPDEEPTTALEAIIRDLGMLALCGGIYWQRKAGGYKPRSLFRLFSKGQ